MPADPEGFLTRWSRRKRGLAAEAEAEAQAPAPAPPGPEATAGSPPVAEPAVDLASLPAVESLTAESDLRLFLRPGVPAGLRQAALRRIWTLDPGIRHFIGPADYAWDFNAPDGVPGFAHTLGGDVAKLLAQAIGQPAPPAASPGSAPPGPAPPGPAPAPPPEATASGVAAPAPDPSPAADAPPPRLPEPPSGPVAPAPRRHGGALPV